MSSHTRPHLYRGGHCSGCRVVCSYRRIGTWCRRTSGCSLLLYCWNSRLLFWNLLCRVWLSYTHGWIGLCIHVRCCWGVLGVRCGLEYDSRVYHRGSKCGSRVQRVHQLLCSRLYIQVLHGGHRHMERFGSWKLPRSPGYGAGPDFCRHSLAGCPQIVSGQQSYDFYKPFCHRFYHHCWVIFCRWEELANQICSLWCKWSADCCRKLLLCLCGIWRHRYGGRRGCQSQAFNTIINHLVSCYQFSILLWCRHSSYSHIALSST